MLSNRQKVFLSDVFSFLLVLFLVILCSDKIIHSIHYLSIEKKASLMIQEIKKLSTDDQIDQFLDSERHLQFFKTGLDRMPQKNLTGLKDASEMMNKQPMDLTKSFDFHGNPYVLEIQVPFESLKELNHEFKIWIILGSALTLLLFSLLSSFFLDLLRRPIQKIKTSKTSYADTVQITEATKDFVANLSHELKTPLTVIRGFAETLHDHLELSEDSKKEMTGRILRQVDRMTRTLQDLFILSQMDEIPDERKEKIDLFKLLIQSSKRIQEIYPDAKIDIKNNNQLNTIFFGDLNLLEIAFDNLIENAVKYSKGIPKVTITIDEVPHFFKIIIQDQGIGIPKSDQKLIFERFYRVDQKPSKIPKGSGLGLFIVQKIIQKHQGRIDVESEVSVGSIFTIFIPKSI